MQFKEFDWLSGNGIYKEWSPFGAKICSDNCPRTLSVPRSEQFSAHKLKKDKLRNVFFPEFMRLLLHLRK